MPIQLPPNGAQLFRVTHHFINPQGKAQPLGHRVLLLVLLLFPAFNCLPGSSSVFQPILRKPQKL